MAVGLAEVADDSLQSLLEASSGLVPLRESDGLLRGLGGDGILGEELANATTLEAGATAVAVVHVNELTTMGSFTARNANISNSTGSYHSVAHQFLVEKLRARDQPGLEDYKGPVGTKHM